MGCKPDLRLVLRSRKQDLLIHSPIHPDGVVLNYLSIEITLLFYKQKENNLTLLYLGAILGYTVVTANCISLTRIIHIN
jgi:hypothetical protein